MSLAGVNNLTQSINTATVQQKQSPQGSGGVSFKQTLEGVRNNISMDALAGVDIQRDMRQLQADLVSGRKISAPELLLYQIRIGQFGLRVELMSKVAEGLLSTVRKFQQGQ